MKVRLLKDNWTLTVLGDNVYHIPETPIETTVPSTVYETLLKKKQCQIRFIGIMSWMQQS